MKEVSITRLRFPSPARTLCLLLLVIFCIESLLTWALPQLVPIRNPFLQIFTATALLALLSSPVLYHYVLKPFLDIAQVQHALADNVLAHLVDGVVLFDRQLTIRSFNGAAERIFGYPAAEIIGREARLILDESCLTLPLSPENCRPGAPPADAVRQASGTRRDGSTVAIEFSLSRVQIGPGWMWIGIVRDISARQEDEQRLKRTLSLLSATLESTNDGIMVRDLDGKIVIANRRFAEMWRIPEGLMEAGDDKLTRAYVLDQLQDPQTFLAVTEKHYAAPDEHTHHLLEFKDGRVFERFSVPQVIDGGIVGRVICCRDVSEQKALEHQLRHAQKMEALGTLAGGVAHDFNNILTVIMGFCNLSSALTEKGTPLKRYQDQIMTASERALTLTNSLLAYSRKQAMNPRPLELNAGVLRTGKFLSRLIGEDIELVTKLAPGKLMVLADSSQLEQVLTNLAANARDAMACKGSLIIGTSRVVIDDDFVRLHGYGRPGAFALISVSDTGTGMTTEVREKIFEPFFTTKQMGQGTGLGLSIVYGIVKQHDGYVNVYSEPGRGTTFNIYLPLIEAAEGSPDEGEQRIRGGSETILLAEDDDGVRALVKIILSGAGYRVIEAADGADAVEKFRADPRAIDLLVLDVVMPKKNGKEAFDEISALRPGTRAIFVSGYTADIIDRNGLVGTGITLISKPLLPNLLLAKVREVLDGGAGG